MASISFKGEKLVGKSNYIEWLTNAKLFLEINGFMPYIDNTEAKPDKNLYYKSNGEPITAELAVRYYEKSSEFNKNNKRALGAIKSIISLENTERFKDKETAYELWNAINSTFGESSLELIGRYFNRLIDTNYSSFKNIDEYTSQIQSSFIYLKELKYPIPKPYIVWLLFKGLPSSFDSFASRKFEEIAKDLDNIDISKLIAELISEEARLNSSLELEANKATKYSKSNNSKDPYCKHCNKKGHLESKCYIKYPELRPKNKGQYNKNPKNKKDSNMDKGIKNESTKVIMSAYNSNSNLDLDSRYKDYITNKIVLDSGATEHYTPNKDWLLNYKEVYNKSIIVANGQKLPVIATGDIPIIIGDKEVVITQVNYIPNLKTTLISPKELTNKGWSIIFKGNKAIVSHKAVDFNIQATWKHNAYYLNVLVDYKSLENVVYKVDTVNKNSLDLYHKRLSHLSKDYLIKTIEHSKGITLDKNLENKELNNCDSCHYGKFHEIVGYKPLKSPLEKLTFYDIDLAGPFRVEGVKGERYILCLTDRRTRAIWIYPIKHKSLVIDIFIEFYNRILNQFNISIKGLRLDNAGEFKSTKWVEFCKDKGIICEYTSPYTPAQNGIAERLNKYVLERLICLCKEKNIPLSLWPYIVQSIAHIKNRTFNSTINMTPYEAITNEKPNISYIRIIGSLAYVLVPKEVRTKKGELGKLANKANKGILVGFQSSNNYLVYLPSEKKVISTRDIVIKEDLIYKDNYIVEEDYSNLLEEPSHDFNILDNNKSLNNENQEQEDNDLDNDLGNESQDEGIINEDPRQNITIQIPRRSIRLLGHEPANTGLSIYNLASLAYLTSLTKGENEDLDNNNKIIINKSDKLVKEPNSYIEAMNSPYKDLWLKAMEKELKSLDSNNTWDIVPSSPNVKPLKTRWVYKIKESNYSDLIEFKARFVAKGFEQLYGLDYIETFASVIKQMAWKLIFALAVLNNWLIYKIDMISAFTQGGIDTNIYLIPPMGLEYLNPNLKDKLLKLNKALYGLKQSARIWYYTLTNILTTKLGFKVLQTESCIFMNTTLNIIVCIYVDDLAIIGPSKDNINSFINSIKKYFNIKELGLIKDYLGIEIDHNLDKHYIKLTQAKYIEKVLEKFNMTNSNPVSTPFDSKAKLEINKEKATIEDIKYFQSVIGSLLYITLGTRPDLAYSVIKLSRFASNPSKEHITATKRVLRYLKGTKDLGITYSIDPNSKDYYIRGYCDSDYAGDVPTSKSTSGYIFYLANGPISWKSKLQSIIAQSTTEAEYISINTATKEAIYIKQLLEELGHFKQSKFPLYTDNNGALLLAKNPVFHERTKHIAVKYHYIRDLISQGIIDLIYIPTKENKSDGFTKPLEKTKFKEFLAHLNFI